VAVRADDKNVAKKENGEDKKLKTTGFIGDRTMLSRCLKNEVGALLFIFFVLLLLLYI